MFPWPYVPMCPPTNERTCLSLFNTIQFSSKRRRESQRLHTTSRCRQEQTIWLLATQRLATSLRHVQYTGCVLFLPSRSKQRKQQEWVRSLVWFKLVRLLRCDLHNLYEGNGEARRELIRENVTVDSHFSGNWLDVKPFKWASRTHEKSSDDEKKKKTEERRKKEKKSVKRASWRALLSHSYFIEALNQSLLDFQWSERIIPEYLLHIMK